MWDYTDKVKDHFLHPRNAGALPDANGVGEVGSLACGDALRLFLKIDEHERIVDATFQTFGCASAIASSSALTELIKGKTLDEALAVTNKDIAAFLGGLPREKMHCSVMGREALEAAIKNFRGETAAKNELEGELVCECFGVTDTVIRRAIAENDLKTVEDVTNFTKAGGGCGMCHEKIEDILAATHRSIAAMRIAAAAPPKAPAMTNLERMRRVTRIIDEDIRPSLRKDGGDVELVDIEGQTVLVALRGACARCPASEMTLRDFVQAKLREFVEPGITVKEVTS